MRTNDIRSTIILIPLLILFGTGIQPEAWGQDRQEEKAGIDWGIAWRYGGLLGGGPTFHSVEMTSLPGVPSCCPGYDGGLGTHFIGGASIEYSLSDRLAVNARLLFDRTTGTLETEEGAFVANERDTAEATFLHTIEETQYGVGVEWLLNYRIVEEFRVMAGVGAGYMFAGDFHQEEKILEPSSIRYENDLRSRMVYDGDLPEMNPLRLSLTAGFRYDLPLDREQIFLLAPEVTLWSTFSPVVKGREWTMLGVRLGVNVFYNGYRRVEPTPLDPLGD